jgi:polyisoprenoid-binding protein YceI
MNTKLSCSLIVSAAIVISSFAPSTGNHPGRPLTAKSSKMSQAATTWTVDKVHSNVKFTVTHMVVSEVGGTFKVFDGTMEHTKPDYSDAKINFSVDVSSVNTENERRDGHLKSDDFFNAEKFPQMKFVSTSFTPAGDNKYKLTGNLTIRDVTKPVTFDVTYGGTITDKGAVKSGFKAKTTLNRFDYNLKWSAATEAGGLVVSKDVDVVVNLEMKKS